MFKIFTIQNNIDNNFYNIKTNLNEIDNIINKYNLTFINKIKIYHKNNIIIISDKNNIIFKKIIDKEIFKENNFIIYNFDSETIKPFSFYDSDFEEEFILYKNSIKNVDIELKIYNKHCELEFTTNNLNSFYNL